MCPLKSAFEIASSRIIATRYKKEEIIDPLNVPEFVTDFEFPGEKLKETEYSRAFMEKHQPQEIKKKKLEMLK